MSKSFIVANILVLLAVRRLLSLKSNQNIKLKLFDATLFTGIAMLYYEWTAVYFLLIYAAIILYEAKDYRNWLVPVLGVATLAVLLSTYFVLKDNAGQLVELFRFKIELDVEKYTVTSYLLPVLFISIIGIVAFFSYLVNIKKRLAQTQASMLLVVVVLVNGILIAMLSDDEHASQLVFSAFPLAVIITSYMERLENNWLKETLLWSFVLMPLLVLML